MGCFVMGVKKIVEFLVVVFFNVYVVFYMCRVFQEIKFYRSFQVIWLFVFDVEYRGQFIFVFGFEIIGRKGKVLDQVYVSKCQFFLLFGVDELWLVYFEVIDIDQVFVVVVFMYVVL